MRLSSKQAQLLLAVLQGTLGDVPVLNYNITQEDRLKLYEEILSQQYDTIKDLDDETK